MRYVLAIAAFVAAIVLITLGIGQRTFLAGPDSVGSSVELSDGARYAYIPSSVLQTHTGRQQIELSGSGTVFFAYGRSADVRAWLADYPYDRLTLDAQGQLRSQLVMPDGNAGSDGGATATPSPGAGNQTPSPTPAPTAATPSAGPTPGGSTASPTPADPAAQVAGYTPAVGYQNPAGSDLWLQEYSATGQLTQPLALPAGMSVIIASDGSSPAPSTIGVQWPTDNRTPWAGPLIVAGLVLAVVGVFLYLLAIDHGRRMRGPRRGGAKRPLAGLRRRRPVKATTIGGALEPPAKPDGRAPRSAAPLRRRLLLPATLGLAGTLALTGCSADYWPDFSSAASPAPTASATPSVAAQQPPAVTQEQLQRILDRLSAATAQADQARNGDQAAALFTGPALQARRSDYTILAAMSDATPPMPIPASPEYQLPQSTDTWPRVVFVVVHDAGTPSTASPDPSAPADASANPDPGATAQPAQQTQPPLGLMLVQDSPHENYRVEYAVNLLSGVTLPEVPPPYLGSPRLAPDFKALALQPAALAGAYGQILMQGAQAPDYAKFDETGDTLLQQVGPDWKKSQQDAPAASDEAETIEFSNAPGSGDPIALATVDGGALVTTSLKETETSKPTQERSVIRFGGEAAALAGKDNSEKGLYQTWEYQLLFYVPPLGSNDKIRLLGYTENLVEAGEVQ